MSEEKFSSYNTAINFLMYGLSKSGGNVFRGEQGLAKTKRFFTEASNPHDGLRAIHIAGTSGKGTVAYMIEAMVRAHGFSTGLALTPHVYDIRERAMINGSLVSQKVFLESINSILPAIIKRFLACESPTYFQVTTLLAFFLMKTHKVDYSVIETGLGGMFDSSNVLERQDKLCVLTRIGKDHTRILGRSYQAIAAQKAGIIQTGNHVIALKQRTDVNREFRRATLQQQATLHFVAPVSDDSSVSRINNPQLVADFQQENLAVALAAVRAIAQRDGWLFSEAKAVKALNNLHLPGRFDVQQKDKKTYIFDGAHNPQKVAALVAQFKKTYPSDTATVVLALKRDKNAEAVINALKPITRELIVTRFLNGQDMSALSHDPVKLARYAKKLGIKVQHTQTATEAINSSMKNPEKILITGSNYLLGEVSQLLDL